MNAALFFHHIYSSSSTLFLKKSCSILRAHLQFIQWKLLDHTVSVYFVFSINITQLFFFGPCLETVINMTPKAFFNPFWLLYDPIQFCKSWEMHISFTHVQWNNDRRINLWKKLNDNLWKYIDRHLSWKTATINFFVCLEMNTDIYIYIYLAL